jgi:hypothetical protein
MTAPSRPRSGGHRHIEPVIFPCDRCRIRPAIGRWGGDDRPARKVIPQFRLCGQCTQDFLTFLRPPVTSGQAESTVRAPWED